MAELFEVMHSHTDRAVIKVIGVGGGGSNTVNQMVNAEIQGVEFICANTDSQHLQKCRADTLLQIGGEVTRGLGAGANPDVGRQAAIEDRDRIREILEGTDMLFITAGMGGGTGTGAAPVVAEIARELEILTVAVVTKPFPFERKKRMEVAKQGIEELHQHVDSLIVIPNERLLTALGKTVSLKEAFKSANDVLQNAVQGIADLITRPGMLNVDFADVRRVMSVQGMAMMGIGSAVGEDRARDAAESALASPLLEELTLTGAEGILVNVAADENMSIQEFQLVNDLISEMASDDAEVIVGMSFDPDLDDEMRVTVVATGLGSQFVGHPVVTPITPIRRGNNGEISYEELDRPTVQRQNPAKRRQRALADDDLDYLDVPAFLRNQAD